MTIENYKNDHLCFSTSKTYTFLIKNLGKIAIINCFCLLIIFYLSDKNYNRAIMILGLIIVGIGPFLLTFTLKNFLSKIKINYKNRKIIFFPIRSQKKIEVSFSDIKGINLKGYITFDLGDKKLFFNTSYDKQLIDSLNRIKTEISVQDKI